MICSQHTFVRAGNMLQSHFKLSRFIKSYQIFLSFSAHTVITLLDSIAINCHMHYGTVLHPKHYTSCMAPFTPVWRGWLKEECRHCKCAALQGKTSGCNTGVSSPWPCITVHSSCSRWFSGSNGCHCAMSSITQHSPRLSSSQLIVIPVKVRGQNVVCSGNR